MTHRVIAPRTCFEFCVVYGLVCVHVSTVRLGGDTNAELGLLHGADAIKLELWRRRTRGAVEDDLQMPSTSGCFDCCPHCHLRRYTVEPKRSS